MTQDHDHKAVGVVCKNVGQTEGAQKENNYSQDLLSMGGSKVDIFINQY